MAAAAVERVLFGCSPAAEIGIPPEHREAVLMFLAHLGVPARESGGPVDGHAMMILYRDPHVPALIDAFWLTGAATPCDDSKLGAAGIWARGRLFGYSEERILDYLRQQQKIAALSGPP